MLFMRLDIRINRENTIMARIFFKLLALLVRSIKLRQVVEISGSFK